jgi:hypothetical protein
MFRVWRPGGTKDQGQSFDMPSHTLKLGQEAATTLGPAMIARGEGRDEVMCPRKVESSNLAGRY